MNNRYFGDPQAGRCSPQLGKWTRRVLLFLLFPVLISCIVTLIANHGDFARMNVFGFRFSIALSGSMEPAILTDAVCLTDMRPQNYKTGDIIVFRHRYPAEKISALICHRIIGTAPNGKFITKGDSNIKEDPWKTDPKDVIGKVIWVGNFLARI